MTTTLIRWLRLNSWILLIALAVVITLPEIVQAQLVPEPEPTAASPGPSAGTLLAAALETAGYKSQSDVLIELKPMLLLLAALLYLGSAFSAFTTITQGGKYEAAVWYFVGPSLFFFICASRTESAGAEWQFGVYKGRNADVQAALDNVDSADSEVSWLFDRYNRLISNVFQQLIGVITNRDEAEYLKFMARSRIMDAMFKADVEDPDLLAFAKYNLLNCGDQLESARRVALGNRDPQYKETAEYKTAEAFYTHSFDQRNFEIPRGIERDYAASVIRAWGGAAAPEPTEEEAPLQVRTACLDETKARLGALGTSAADPEVASDGVDELLNEGVSCQDMWCWMGLGIQQHAVEAAKLAQEKYLPEDAGPELAQQVWEEIAVKLTTPSGQTDAQGRYFGGANPDLSVIPIIFTGNMTRKLMTQDLHSEFLTQFANHSGISLKPFNYSNEINPEQSRQIVERQNQYIMSQAKQYEIFHFAMTIPYFQGAILYVLATTFPFFALMVIIPGQAGAFFQWMALWAWAKSWDLGFAVVMVVDDFLWSMMPHNSYYHELTDPVNSPITSFESAFHGDPAYSLASYYTIVGALLTSVPMVTAQAILGSKKALAGALIGGLKGVSAEVGGFVRDATALQQLAAGQYLRENNATKYAMANLNNDANLQTKGIGGLAKEIDASGQKWKAGGSVAWGGAAVAGVGGLAAGGLAAASALGLVAAAPLALPIASGLAVAAGAFGLAGYGARTAGLGMTQMASGLERSRRELNYKFHNFNYSGTAEFRGFDARRGGISRRGEFWNVTNDPATAFKDADVSYRNAKAEWNKLSKSGLGTLVAAAYAGLTRGGGR